MRKLVVKRDDSKRCASAARTVRIEVTLLAPDDPAWVDAQVRARERIDGHPATDEEKLELLDMLGLSA